MSESVVAGRPDLEEHQMQGSSSFSAVLRRSSVGVIAAAVAGLGVSAQQAFAAPVNSLVGHRNQISISYDPTSNACVAPGFSRFGAPTPNEPDCFSYSGIALQAAGATPGSDVKVGGFDFQWPNTTSGQPDSLSPDGQTVPVNAPLGTDTLALLDASGNTAQSSEIDLNYTTPDCNGQTTDQQSASFPDWWGPVQAAANELQSPFELYGNAVVLPVQTGVYAVQVPVDPTRKLVSVTFPGHVYVLRVFDVQPATTGNVTYACTPAGNSGNTGNTGAGASAGSTSAATAFSRYMKRS
jgi:hypothetical protein